MQGCELNRKMNQTGGSGDDGTTQLSATEEKVLAIMGTCAYKGTTNFYYIILTDFTARKLEFNSILNQA